MSIIQRLGRDAIEHLEKQEYLFGRRVDVEYAWQIYKEEAEKRYLNGEESPYSAEFEELNRQTDAFIRREAQRFARSCRQYRIFEDDFESHFRFTVMKAALAYDGDRGTFFDYLRGAIRNAGRDLIRKAKAKERQINHLAVSFDDEKIARKIEEQHSEQGIEVEVVNRSLIEEMAADKTLTPQERQLFNFLRSYPEATLQEMADELGLRDRKQASRIKERLARKLRKYLQD